MDIDYSSQTSRIKIYKLLFLSILIIILNINFLNLYLSCPKILISFVASFASL